MPSTTIVLTFFLVFDALFDICEIGATTNSYRTFTRSGSRLTTRKKSVKPSSRLSSRRFRGDSFRKTSSTPTYRPCARRAKRSCEAMECSIESFTKVFRGTVRLCSAFLRSSPEEIETVYPPIVRKPAFPKHTV